jgi:hypothetical protein
MLTNFLVTAFGCLVVGMILLLLAGRITQRQFAGWMTIGYIAAGVLSAVNGWTSTLYMTAAGAALFGWLWWHSGGGDGTRRRLKSWARRFEGVRRTAPQGA